jgi:hypothetical protein
LLQTSLYLAFPFSYLYPFPFSSTLFFCEHSHPFTPPNIHPLLLFLMSSFSLPGIVFFLVPVSQPLESHKPFFIFHLHLFPFVCSSVYLPHTANTFLWTTVMKESSLSSLQHNTLI